jgi:hypothetical protein
MELEGWERGSSGHSACLANMKPEIQTQVMQKINTLNLIITVAM